MGYLTPFFSFAFLLIRPCEAFWFFALRPNLRLPSVQKPTKTPKNPTLHPEKPWKPHNTAHIHFSLHSLRFFYSLLSTFLFTLGDLLSVHSPLHSLFLFQSLPMYFSHFIPLFPTKHSTVRPLPPFLSALLSFHFCYNLFTPIQQFQSPFVLTDSKRFHFIRKAFSENQWNAF